MLQFNRKKDAVKFQLREFLLEQSLKPLHLFDCLSLPAVELKGKYPGEVKAR
jgi:hypothetical protein